MTRTLVASCAAALLVGFVVAAPMPAHAQDDRRVAALEKQVRELRAIVFQGRDTGQPVIVKPEGPDPQVVALQGRVDALEEQLRQLTGRLEVAGHDVDEARRGAEQAKAEDAASRQTLSDRITRLEAQLSPTPPATVAAPQASAAPPPAQFPSNARGADVTRRAQADDTGSLGAQVGGGQIGGQSGGGHVSAPSAPTASFEDAYQHLSDGDYAGAQAGFQAYLAKSPTSARAPEANYYIGQSLYVRENYAEAARAYAMALKGWPKSKWAPDATVKLAQALVQLERPAPACQALGEFDRRYAPLAITTVKARAQATRARAACGA